MIPGVGLFLFAVTFNVAQVAGWSTALAGIWPPTVIVIGIFALIVLANWFAARSLKREIEAIDALA